MLTDDEKYIFSEKRTIEEVQSYTRSNAADIIAIGFDLKKTFIFSDFDYMGGAFYRNVTRISKHVTLNVARAVFGFNDRYLGLCYSTNTYLPLFAVHV
jgi:tryptophanyl-tRNA synthetase